MIRSVCDHCLSKDDGCKQISCEQFINEQASKGIKLDVKDKNINENNSNQSEGLQKVTKAHEWLYYNE